MSIGEQVAKTLDFIRVRKDHCIKILRSCVTADQIEVSNDYFEEMIRQIHQFIGKQEDEISLFWINHYKERVIPMLRRAEAEYLDEACRQIGKCQ